MTTTETMTAFDIIKEENIETIIRAIGKPQNDAERLLLGSMRYVVEKIERVSRDLQREDVIAIFALTKVYEKEHEGLIHELKAYAISILTYRENQEEAHEQAH